MPTAYHIQSNLYRDSVSLMQISAQLSGRPGINQAHVVMATPANLELLQASGLGAEAPQAGPNDVLIAVHGDSKDVVALALDEARQALQQGAGADPTQDAQPGRPAPRSLEMGLETLPTANLALISTPGEYAAAEALKALRLGLNVMLFSDNVTLADEIALKRYAHQKGLLVMGPDCGTALVDGIPLGFANVVRRGQIGLVAASGTGLQQVSCLVDRLGEGISHAIGTGGRDLHAEIGGRTMLQGIKALAGDAGTKVLVLLSKPPAPAVAQRVLDAARQVSKPVVVNFLGAAKPDHAEDQASSLFFVETLAEAAHAAVMLARDETPQRGPRPLSAVQEAWIGDVAGEFSPQQRFLRGLFSGGTFCYEAGQILTKEIGPVYSNIAVQGGRPLDDLWVSQEHTLLDLGDDEFTRGRPHPMIDQRLRNERIVQTAEDEEVAVLLLDVVLGYGAHEDPAAEMAPVLAEARRIAARAGRRLAVIGWVCGTAGDPQDGERQAALLRNAGMVLADSSTQAAQLAAALVCRLADR